MSVDITVIVALIAAIAAIIAPVVQTIFMSAENKKLKKFELTYPHKVAAYNELLTSASLLLDQPTEDSFIAFKRAVQSATLFSDLCTIEKIDLFEEALLEDSRNGVTSTSPKYNAAYRELLLALHLEITLAS